MKFFKKGNLIKFILIFTLFMTQLSFGSIVNAETPKLELIEGETPKLELIEGETPELELNKVEIPKLELIEGETIELELVEGETTEIETMSANLVSITATVSDTNLRVRVGNIGLDPLDYANVTVKATNTPEQKKYGSKIIPAYGMNFDFDIPQTKVKMIYNITVEVTDGGIKQISKSSAELKISDSDLEEWHPGTQGSKENTVNHHFDKHANDKFVKAKTVKQYLAQASAMHVAVRGIKAETATYKFEQKKASGQFVAYKKYTHKTTGQFIMVTDTSHTSILSFGGN